jgi:putative ABC transport system permease protein
MGEDGIDPEEVCRRIRSQTGLGALTREQFAWKTMALYLTKTGILVNFAVTVLLGFGVGAAISGQTFYIFTVENLKQFGALKAMGASNTRIVGMILLQAGTVGLIGYGLGMGLSALFGELSQSAPMFAFYMPVEVLAGTAIGVVLMLLLASAISVRRVIRFEPAIVFQG